jgi:RimJ/RimL family protein N-acetyltransferase
MQFDLTRIQGPNLVLRLVVPEDASYIHGLRVDTAYNTHLSEVRGAISEQRTWIEDYKKREAAEKELYYIITRYDGRPCGTVRLYDIKEESFTWGSWILDHNKVTKAALESAVLSFGVGFERLATKLAHIDVCRDNTRAINFYRRFGMIETHCIAQKMSFIYTRSCFLTDRDRYLQILKEAL